MIDSTAANRGPVSMVTGAASGIGRHMALSLYRRGHRLQLLDLSLPALEELAQSHGLASERVLVRALDVRDKAGWEGAALEAQTRFGRIDYLFNIAGVLRAGYVHEMPSEDLLLQLSVNAGGVMLGTSVVSRIMVAQRAGHIINIASIAGLSHVAGLAAYCASKHAVRGFSLSVAHELRPHGVYVSALCPDAVETPMLTQQETHPEAAMTFGAGRALSLEEVETALFAIMRTRPLERVLGVPRSGRAWAARLANAFPVLTQLAQAHVVQRGKAAQKQRLSQRT